MVHNTGGISPRGVFSDEDLELRYRRDQLPRDAALARRFLQAIAAAAQVFVISDYVFLGFTRALAAMAFSRLVLGGALLAAAAAARRASSPRAFERHVLAALLLLASYIVGVAATRPPTYAGGLIVAVIAVAAIYCVSPLPVALQCVPSLFLSAGCLAIAVRGSFGGAALVAAFTSFALVNGLGMFASLELHRSKREMFLAAVRQSELRGELETALAEVRTLRGVVPICSHCKMIRDGEGEWHNVEDYVRRRTHAQFSHGVCPTCVKSHYSAF
ncbi:MAG: hypothetical protein ACHQ49_10080 [Elusimicrobiota bacterium]